MCIRDSSCACSFFQRGRSSRETKALPGPACGGRCGAAVPGVAVRSEAAAAKSSGARTWPSEAHWPVTRRAPGRFSLLRIGIRFLFAPAPAACIALDSSRLSLSCGDERARRWGGASGLATWFMPKPCAKRNEKEFRVKRPRSMHHQSRIGTPQSAKSRDYVRISTSGKHASGKDVGYARIEKPDAFSFRFAYNGLRLS